MSYFAFQRDNNGDVLVSDQQAAEALELVVNLLALISAQLEEAFDTKLTLQDIENGPDSR